LNRAMVHPREVFAPAVEQRAASVVIAHNHPSGNLEPSEEDRDVTRRIADAGEILGIGLLDHLIFSRDSWFSFREAGHL
jgi:DNA repair protein RadC